MFKRYRNMLIYLIIGVILASLIWAGYRAYWTGFGVKTLWDWMELLIIPIMLGAGALFFNWVIQKAERMRAQERQRQDTLTTYFDRMQELLLKHKLRRSKKNAEVRIAARARTVSALRNLDGRRIAQLLHFLTESDLGGEKLLRINLEKADLQGINLSGVDLQGADLYGANLQGAILRKANLQRASLVEVNLQEASLYKAKLQRASLYGANLQRAILIEASLQGASLFQANLQRASLDGANLREANLYGANLQRAILHNANLQRAILRKANLQRASLIDAKLQEASLIDAKSLKAAMMPEGTRFEKRVAKGKPDWIKEKRKRPK